jgi:hypothetical protein
VSAAPLIYALVTLTVGGEVHFSNPTSLHLCEEGRSIAVYGRTIEDEAAAEAAAARAQTAATHQWYDEHPPRPPRTSAERDLVRALLQNARSRHENVDGGCETSGGDDGPVSCQSITPDGDIQDDPPVALIEDNAIGGIEVQLDRDAIRLAVCAIWDGEHGDD